MKSTYNLWTIIHITALMETFAIPHNQMQTNALEENEKNNNDVIDVVPIFEVPPKCAGESTYCEDIDLYPNTLVSRLLENTSYIFHDPSDMKRKTLDVAAKNSAYEEVLCRTENRIITPKIGLTATDGWLFIVNDNSHRQVVSVEECWHHGVCQLQDKGNFFLLNGYDAKCKQKRSYVEMLVLLPNGTLHPKPVSMPSCCQCTFTKTRDWRPNGNFR